MSGLVDSFINPELWPLLLLAVLPVVLYLLDRHRARRVDWPALRFFLARRASRLRWIRLREALLIVVRTLAILAIVLTFLRPVAITEIRRTTAESPLTRGFVLVVDSSASMGYEHDDGRSSLEVARRTAIDLLGSLRDGDSATLLAGAASLEEVSGDGASLDLARDALRALRPSGGVFDLATAIDLALETSTRLPSRTREIFILSDLQHGDVEDDSDRPFRFLASRWRSDDARPEVTIVDCGVEAPSNARVTALRPDAGIAGTDKAVSLRARIVVPRSRSGTLSLRLLVDDEVAMERQIDTDEMTRSTSTSEDSVGADITLTHRFARAGEHRIRLELLATERLDPLRVDDARSYVLEVHDRIDVLIVEPDGDETREESGRFIDLALFPTDSEARPIDVIFRPRRTSKVTPEEVSRASAIILADLPSLDDDTSDLIESRVRSGAGLLVFAGARAKASEYDERLHRGGAGLMPTRLVQRIERPGEAVTPIDVDLSHPALSVFASPDDGDLRRVPIHAHWTTGSLPADARVLARIDRSTPWILERDLGGGRVILVTTSATPADSDLPRTPLFVPVLHGLVRHLALEPRDGEATNQGEPLEVTLREGEENASITVTGPDSSPLPTARIDDGRPRWRCEDTTDPGFYTFHITREEHGARSTMRAVNVDPRESNLTRIPTDRLDPLRTAVGLRVVRDVHETRGGDLTAKAQVERWPHVLAAALLLLFLELALLSRLGRGRAPWTARAAA